MVERLTYRRHNRYNTKSNKKRIVKTPGGRLVYQHVQKKAKGPMCGDCGKAIIGVPRLRPVEYSRLKKRERRVNRAYGGSRCAGCTRTRVIRAFLIEINAGGLIDEWNMKRDDLKVMPGDHIVQVNDVAGDFKLLKKELVKYQEMTITIHRYSEEEGFDPNTRDKNGNSALHLAVRSGKLPLVEALASSPDLMVNAKDRYCRTALDIAKDNQFDDIFAFLKKKCARLACEVTSPQREHNRRSGRAATALAKVRSEAEPADAAPPEAEEQRPKTAETLLHTMTGPC